MEERLNVLVVEDEGIVSAGIVCCVQELGHTVTGQAFSGTEAIEQARQSKIDHYSYGYKSSRHDGN